MLSAKVCHYFHQCKQNDNIFCNIFNFYHQNTKNGYKMRFKKQLSLFKVKSKHDHST